MVLSKSLFQEMLSICSDRIREVLRNAAITPLDSMLKIQRPIPLSQSIFAYTEFQQFQSRNDRTGSSSRRMEDWVGDTAGRRKNHTTSKTTKERGLQRWYEHKVGSQIKLFQCNLIIMKKLVNHCLSLKQLSGLDANAFLICSQLVQTYIWSPGKPRERL